MCLCLYVSIHFTCCINQSSKIQLQSCSEQNKAYQLCMRTNVWEEMIENVLVCLNWHTYCVLNSQSELELPLVTIRRTKFIGQTVYFNYLITALNMHLKAFQTELTWTTFQCHLWLICCWMAVKNTLHAGNTAHASLCHTNHQVSEWIIIMCSLSACDTFLSNCSLLSDYLWALYCTTSCVVRWRMMPHFTRVLICVETLQLSTFQPQASLFL